MSWQRARSSSQIEFRVQEILTAAAKLFQSLPFENVTMQLIAKEASFTRSNLYRYFKTKEEIFLNLYVSDVRLWAVELTLEIDKEMSIPRFIEIWTAVLFRQERFLRLAPLLTISLEKNSSEEVYREIKYSLNGLLPEIVQTVKRALPKLSEKQIGNFLEFNQILAAGTWPMSQYTDMQLKVLAEPELSHFKIDFQDFCRQAIATYLTGLVSS